jgi:hypothetical protein
MSDETKYFLNGIAVRPDNADSIGFRSDFTNNVEELQLNTDSIIFKAEAHSIILNHIASLGVFEGIPLTIQIDGVSIEYYIDLQDSPRITDSESEVKIVKRFSYDDFFSKAKGLSFESLNANAPIQNIFNIDYVIVKDNQVEILITLGLSTYQLTKALIEGIQDVAEASAELVQATTLNVGVTPSADLGDILALVIKAVARIIYVAAIIIAILSLIEQIFEVLFPKIRQLKASFFKELMRQGCEYLGYEFESELLDNPEISPLTYLPVPLLDTSADIFQVFLNIQQSAYNKGYPTANDSTPLLSDLFEQMESFFWAKTRIVNGNVVKFESEDYWFDNPGINVINTLNIQETRENSYSFRFDDVWKRKLIGYRYDESDVHTLNNLERLSTEYSTEPVTVVNADLVNIRGLDERRFPFAFGIRKNSLNYVEKVALTLAKFADSIVNFFGGNSNLASQIQSRVGLLQISQQHFSMSKVLWTINGRQPSNYLDKIGADVIYKRYHINAQVKENFERVETATIPFSAQNFVDLQNNNVVTDQTGTDIEILTIDWINETRQAVITYVFKSSEGNNTKTILIDD